MVLFQGDPCNMNISTRLEKVDLAVYRFQIDLTISDEVNLKIPTHQPTWSACKWTVWNRMWKDFQYMSEMVNTCSWECLQLTCKHEVSVMVICVGWPDYIFMYLCAFL